MPHLIAKWVILMEENNDFVVTAGLLVELRMERTKPSLKEANNKQAPGNRPAASYPVGGSASGFRISGALGLA